MLTARLKGDEARCAKFGCGEVLGRWVRNGEPGPGLYEAERNTWHFTIPGILMRRGVGNDYYEEPAESRRARVAGHGSDVRRSRGRRDDTHDRTFGPGIGTERWIFTLPITVRCLKCRWENEILPDAAGHPLTAL